jgi:hypothetical protein
MRKVWDWRLSYDATYGSESVEIWISSFPRFELFSWNTAEKFVGPVRSQLHVLP